MTNILAFSGKKQSGKNTCFNYLLATTLQRLAIVQGDVRLVDNNMYIDDLFGDTEMAGRFSLDSGSDEMISFCNKFIWPFLKEYSFADVLKRKICVETLGLSEEQVYGTDEEKKMLTELRWEDMPGVITNLSFWSNLNSDTLRGIGDKLVFHSPGQMSGRDVMQYIGTDVFRRMKSDIWATTTINQIQADSSQFAVITDCRFPDEVRAVQEAGGKVIRLCRNGDSIDEHESEKALDKDNFDWNTFDGIIENEEMDMTEQHDVLYALLKDWEWLDEIEKPSTDTP